MNTFKLLTLSLLASGLFFVSSCETECIEPVNMNSDSCWYNPADTTGTPYDSTYYGGGTPYDSIPWNDSLNPGGGPFFDTTGWGGGGTGTPGDSTGWGDSTNFGGW